MYSGLKQEMIKANTDICDAKQIEYSKQYLCSQGRTQTDRV